MMDEQIKFPIIIPIQELYPFVEGQALALQVCARRTPERTSRYPDDFPAVVVNEVKQSLAARRVMDEQMKFSIIIPIQELYPFVEERPRFALQGCARQTQDLLLVCEREIAVVPHQGTCHIQINPSVPIEINGLGPLRASVTVEPIHLHFGVDSNIGKLPKPVVPQ
jgi:hypothetical protein